MMAHRRSHRNVRLISHLKTRHGRRAAILALAILALVLSVPGISVPKATARERQTWVAIYPRLYEPGIDAHYYQHPYHLHLIDADSEIRFTSLHWRRWGSQTAVATGHAKACGEGGPEGFHCEAGRVRLVAGHLGTCPITGNQFYQHLVAIHPPLYLGRLEIPVAPVSSSCGPP